MMSICICSVESSKDKEESGVSKLLTVSLFVHVMCQWRFFLKHLCCIESLRLYVFGKPFSLDTAGAVRAKSEGRKECTQECALW